MMTPKEHEELLRFMRWQVAYNMLCHQDIKADDILTKNSCLHVSEDFRILIKMCNSGLPREDRTDDLVEIVERGLPTTLPPLPKDFNE